MNTEDLENRLIDFAVRIIEIAAGNKKNYAGKHLADKIVRSGTAVSLTYEESQRAKSRKGAVQKMQLVLKELRETLVNLKIITDAKLNIKTRKLILVLSENIELIAIIEKSIQLAKKSRKEKKAERLQVLK